MRATLLVVGLLLLVAGALISAGMLSVPREKEVLRIGGASLSVNQQRKPDVRVGWALLAAGVVIGGAGLATRRRR